MTTESQQSTDIAVIKISPARDEAVLALTGEAQKLKQFAIARIIAKDDDLKPATDDLSLIAKLKKALAEKKAEYVKPIKSHLDTVNALFQTVLAPLEDADKITRQKVTAYREEQLRRQAEAEAINREKMELARREETLTGEHTVDLTPIEAPVPVAKIQTDMGSAGVMRVRKWELVDFKAVPDDLKMLDAGKITKLVKAGIGEIAGIRIFEEETIRVTTR